ncbi:hypothetical protein BGX28_002477 [Mortierella sp. GBA30]|nr:hypothetical protein BGX28_002477 [Mortierella sp. GBA30]
MVSADEVLSIVTAVLYTVLLLQFFTRFAITRWWIYFFCGLFCAIRVAAYVVKAYVDTLEYGTKQWISLYIAEMTLINVGMVFILLILARLYHSILPKLRHQDGQQPRGKFEATLVDRTRLFLLPVIALVIAGAVMGSSDSESQLNTSVILRKVSVLALLVIGLIFFYAAWVYRQRYPDHRYQFNLCFFVTALFNISLIYKVVYTFQASVTSSTWAFFVFSPLMELVALGALCVDLRTHFLGRKEDKIPKGEEQA